MSQRNLKTMIWMVGFFLMVGCSAGSNAVRKDRETREENSSRQQNIGLKNGDLSQLQKKLGRPNNSPKEISIQPLRKHVAEKTPMRFMVLKLPMEDSFSPEKVWTVMANGRDSLSSFQQISLRAHIGWTRRRKFLMSGPSSSGVMTPKTEATPLLRLRNRYLSQDLPPNPITGCNVFLQSLI